MRSKARPHHAPEAGPAARPRNRDGKGSGDGGQSTIGLRRGMALCLRRPIRHIWRSLSSTGTLSNPGAAAAWLVRNAVDCLPEAELERRLGLDRPLRVKLGIDPTAPDIHLGFTVVLQKLREFQDLGHVVVLIVGDYTARVGDPSGRSSTRPVLDPGEIAANAQTFKDQALTVLDSERLEVRFNSEWLDMS